MRNLLSTPALRERERRARWAAAWLRKAIVRARVIGIGPPEVDPAALEMAARHFDWLANASRNLARR